MKSERVLSLDISTKTGWAFALSSENGIELRDYGTIPKIQQPEGSYPSNYILWAYACFEEILKLIDKFKPDILVIEETSKGSKNGMSQKILEFVHFMTARYIKETGIRSQYFMTEEWRREIGCKMTKEEKVKNKTVRDYKKDNKTIIAYDLNGKRIGLTGRKHVNIRRVSEIFHNQLREPLKRKDEDLADGLGLLACYHMRRFKSKESEDVSLEDLIKDKV